MSDIPVGQAYDGPSGVGRDSIWLTHEDLIPGKDQVVTIHRVVKFDEVTFEGGIKRKNYLGLEFKDAHGRVLGRTLGLNATNRRTLVTAFGNMTGKWVGSSITLYVTTTKAKAGEIVPCVRIREQKNKAIAAAEANLGLSMM